MACEVSGKAGIINLPETNFKSLNDSHAIMPENSFFHLLLDTIGIPCAGYFYTFQMDNFY